MVFNTKKAQSFIPIIVIILLVLLVFGIVNVVVGKTFTEINTAITGDESLSESARNVSNNLHEQYSGIMDNSFLVVLTLLFILGMIAAYSASGNPFFLVVLLIIMIIIVVAGMLLSNVYEDLTKDGDFGVVSNDYPVTDWVLSNYGLVSLLMVSAMLITLFIRNRGSI